MKKNQRSMRSIDSDIRKANVQDIGTVDETLAGRLARVLTIFGAVRPLLLLVTTFSLVPPASRMTVALFVQSLDALAALAQAGDADAVEDFKAGRDL